MVESNSLKAQISSVDRAFRYLEKVQTELQPVLDNIGTAAPDDPFLREDLSAKIEMLKQECENCDDLLSVFERKAAETEDQTYKEEQVKWGDQVYDGRRKLAEANRVLARSVPRTPSGVPPSNDSAATPVSSAQAPSSSGQADLADQFSRLLSVLESRAAGSSQPSAGPSPDPNASGTPRVQHFTKLPKLELPKFEGDILKFHSFWDRFTASVDSDSRLAPVDKLNYLVSMLGKEPLMHVGTLPMINENYDKAKAALLKKYDDKKLVIALLYRKLNELKSVSNDAASLRKFVAEIDCLFGPLDSLGQGISDDNFATIILSKLPTSVVVMLEITKDVTVDWTVDLVRSKLSDYLLRIDRAARISATGKGNGSSSHDFEFTGDSFFAGDGASKKGARKKENGGSSKAKGGESSGSKGQARGGAPQPRKPACAFCEGSHYSDKCLKFTTADERSKHLGNRCRVCLNPNHHKKDCNSQKPCHYCQKVGNHHSSLCFKQFPRKSEQGGFAGDGDSGAHDDGKGGGGGSTDGGASMLAAGEGVALQTAKIPVTSDSDNKTFVVTRSLMDIGASRTYATMRLARKVGMKLTRGPNLKVNRFGSEGAVSVPTMTGKLKLRKLDGSLETIEVSVIENITGQMVRTPVKSENLERLRSRVHMADDVPSDFEQCPIELLIGNDYYLDFVSGEKITVDPGLYLLGSDFGYILSGRTQLHKQDGYSMTMLGMTCGVLEGLEDVVVIPGTEDCHLKKPMMSGFFGLVGIGITEDPDVTSDDLAVQNFEQNVTFVDGRYSVTLPFNDRASELCSNYKLSVGRLNSLVNRLKSDEALFQSYNGVIQDQLQKGVIEKVDRQKPVAKSHYIPHHAVVDPTRETTKVRIVYDGSAKSRKDSPSLNDCLHRGPVLLEDLVGLIMRFRTHKYAIIADIEKAFLQIGIDPADRDMLRFLWLEDPSKKSVDGNLAVYRFCRVLFGLNCSPSLLLQTVRHHLNSVGTPVANQICDNLYADNVITGVESLDEGKKFYSESKAMFRDASMNLRQWTSNLPELVDFIPSDDRVKVQAPKVLGLKWERGQDTLGVASSPKLQVTARTKREFLSQLSTVFDPLGFFTPVTVTGKVLLQAACESKPGWDTELAEAVVQQWDEQRQRVLEIPMVPVPRFIQSRGQCMLIAFCDASTTSFATAVYLRCESELGVSVNLLMSKTRLNPVKKLTIPRLELLAVLIGVRGLKFVASQMKIPMDGGMVFSDSSCTLAWLKCQKKQDVFVRNRVKEIAKSKPLTFRYVNTTENPADWATRGKTAAELNGFWWNGPDFVAKPKSEWPSWGFDEVKAAETEVPTSVLHQMSLLAVSPDPLLDLTVKKFSSHLRLVRISAWCLRFIDRLRKTGETGMCLTADELKRAQMNWERNVQAEAYGSTLAILARKREAQMGDLTVFKDSEGLLRCKGRMEKAELTWESKFPKLLPKSHPYTRLLVHRVHTRGGHLSVRHTLISLRNEFWIPKGRQQVKSMVHKCVVCRKAAGRPFARPPMPELPSDRVVPQPCFTSTGVDYFGPLKLRGPSKTEKAWVALFTCLSSRAIHLELVQDLSAEELLLAFRRFIARRGKPRIMLSDNGTQFKAVAKVIEATWNRVLQDPSILDFSACEGIQWSFIVKYAPFMGGVYERLVGIVKTCLRKTIGSALLTPKRFETLLCECEAIVNTRPLSYVSSDVDDGFVLTPAHFLSLNPRVAVPEMPRLLKKDRDLFALGTSTLDELVDSWKKGQNLLTEFWRAWKQEYLSALRERMTYQHRGNQGTPVVPKVDDVVLMKEVGLPRGSWEIARIVKIHHGADGRIRSATVYLPSGRQLHRPINLLVPLEVVSEVPNPASGERDLQGSHVESEPDDFSSGRASPEFLAHDNG